MLKNDINIPIMLFLYKKSMFCEIVKKINTLFMKKFNINVLPIIGMSPGNSYFNQETISKLLRKVLEKYDYAVIFVPDIPAISTYEATGYSFKKAKRKARLKSNNLKNKTHHSIKQCAISNELVYVLNWKEDVQILPLYIESYDRIADLFQNNKKFRNEILNTTRGVLESSGKDIVDMQKSLLKGSEYILSEFAFLEICPKLFGCKEARFIYHKDWPVYQDYISGSFDNSQRGYLGFEKISFTQDIKN